MKSGSRLERVLEAGHFAFTAELGPPQGTNVEAIKKKASHLKGITDAVNITDNQTAVVRMASWAASLLAIQEGLEPNYQMVCRDRNRIAMQSDILGAYALGVRNMLCLSGDHQSGGHPKSGRFYEDRSREEADRPSILLLAPDIPYLCRSEQHGGDLSQSSFQCH